MNVQILALMVSCVVGIFGVLTFAFSRQGENGKREYWEGQTTNQLSAISDDIKDMKANQRTYERQLFETREIAIQAKASADKANERLDNLHIGGTDD